MKKTLKEILYPIFILIFTFLIVATLFIMAYDDVKTSGNIIDFCKSQGYDGIADMPGDFNNNYRCYKENNGFIEYSPEVIKYG